MEQGISDQNRLTALSEMQPREPVLSVPAAEQESAVGPEHLIEHADDRPLLLAIRPLLFAAAIGLAVAGIYLVSGLGDVDPRSPRTEYGLHFAAMVVAAFAVAAMWWARQRKQSWAADLLPGLFGGLAALTLLIALHGTPFDIYGIYGDQSFRTAAVTRFADSWQGGDYTYRGLPFYYAPAYFWVLGRLADIGGVEPWRMLKFGSIALASLTPIVSYLMWRRLVSIAVAALIAIAPLIFPDTYEPYGWIIQVAIVPWWLEAIHGLRRPELRPRHPVVLGVIGGVIFVVYYYYFFVFTIVFALHHALEWWRGEFAWSKVGRGVGVLGIAALTSSFFWAPLAWNFLTAPHFESLNNRWLTASHGDLSLPMLEPSVSGVLCLIGLIYIVWTAREALSRALLIVVVSLYVWHATGYLFLIMDKPLMSFRMKSLIPLVLIVGTALAVVRVAKYAARRLSARDVARLAAVGSILLAVFSTDHFVTSVVDDQRVKAAHNETLPNGGLPPFHDVDAKADRPAAADIRAAIEATYTSERNAVVLSDRSDIFAFYPYFGFLQWNANYSHPTGQYHLRLGFIENVAKASTAKEFADRTANNPFDRIDAFVLRLEGDKLEYDTHEDMFPYGTTVRRVTIPANLVTSEYFRLTKLDKYLVAVRKPAS